MTANAPTSSAQLSQAMIAKAAATAVGAITEAGILFDLGPSQAANPPSKIIFPSDLYPDNSQRRYSLQMQFSKYVKRSQQQSKAVILDDKTPSIFLPLPNQLRDDKTVTYDMPELGTGLGVAINSALENKNNLSAAATSAAVSGTVGEAATVLNKIMGSSIASSMSTLSGTAFNPFQTLLFKTPNFRTHNFSWKLAPKNEQESKDIRDIIKYLYINMLPNIDASAAIFQYPSIVNVQLNPVTDYLYAFKPCVLTSVSANYAPQSTPAFYKGSNAPAVIDLSIELREIELWTRIDYPGQSATSFNFSSLLAGVVSPTTPNTEQYGPPNPLIPPTGGGTFDTNTPPGVPTPGVPTGQP